MRWETGVKREGGENIKLRQKDICNNYFWSTARAPFPSVPEAWACHLLPGKDKKNRLVEKRTVRRKGWKEQISEGAPSNPKTTKTVCTSCCD